MSTKINFTYRNVNIMMSLKGARDKIFKTICIINADEEYLKDMGFKLKNK